MPTTTTTKPSLARLLQQLLANTSNMTDETSMVPDEPIIFPGIPNTWAFALPDVLRTSDGSWVLIELNTSNAAGTSPHGDDQPRIDHELATITGRNLRLEPGDVTLMPHSPDTRSVPEITVRALLRSHGLTAHGPVLPIGPTIPPRPDAINVVLGPIPAIAENLTIQGDELHYAGHRVAFFSNGNVLAELARNRQTTLSALLDTLNLDIAHEGDILLRLGFDKFRQQKLTRHTGLAHLDAREALTTEEAVTTALAMASEHGHSIIKPSAASGGSGVIPVNSTDTAEHLRVAMADHATHLANKYGPRWATTCLPWGIYQFAKAQPVQAPWGPVIWDLRMMATVTPDATTITPLSARLGRAPITDDIERANAVVNQTGRDRNDAASLSPARLLDLLSLPTDALLEPATAIWRYLHQAHTGLLPD